MADQSGYNYREMISTTLDVLAVLAVAAGVGFALLPVMGWSAVGVAGAVLYAGVHADALADVTLRLVGEVRKRRAAARAVNAAALAAEQKRLAAEVKALAKATQTPTMALPELNGGTGHKVDAS